MTAPRSPRPLTKRGRVVVWVLTVLIASFGLGGGIALITEGLDGRDALAGGPAGTLTPTDRQCGRDSCSWIGDFTSDDGTITRTDVELRDAERVGLADPMPARIDDVRLHDADRPAAYTADYDSRTRVAAGAALLVACLVGAALLVRMLRRNRAPEQS
ncbi:hypothetical protein [Jiangella alba]|uniref:Uncharacterized protein n=1 Tax=Jiangella alba TaxID=561176 RepID=A0A1H5HW35_9ACTN|nr:hypothetical protein [Jiangella alba]SEE32306.1 hypothetical protein SAMN04488561_0986 [Jiangella alba]